VRATASRPADGLAFERSHAGGRLAVALDFGGAPAACALGPAGGVVLRVS
jgi:hypothetical protein